VELVKNKASGKPFIVLDDAGKGRFVLITPEGKIKSLERRLFDPLGMVEEEAENGGFRLTTLQMATFADQITSKGAED